MIIRKFNSVSPPHNQVERKIIFKYDDLIYLAGSWNTEKSNLIKEINELDSKQRSTENFLRYEYDSNFILYCISYNDEYWIMDKTEAYY